MQDSITERVTIDADPEAVFAFINTPGECVRASPSQVFHDIEDLDNGGHEYDYEFRMVGVSLSGHCESVVCDTESHELVYDYTGDIDAEMRLSVSPADGGSEFRCETTYTVPDSVFGRVAKPVIERFNSREMTTFTENVRDIVESDTVEGSARDTTAT